MDQDIIDKVLNNKGTCEEARTVVDWFSSEEGNKDLDKRIQRESEVLTEERISSWTTGSIPEEKMQKTFSQWIGQKQNHFRRWIVAAAFIPFVLMLGVTFFLANRVGVFDDDEFVEFVVPVGQQMQIVLQDGTIAQLNSETKLFYPKHFSLFNRKIQLQGEGYFKVAKDKSRPFYIDLNGLQVKVTGTQFNVKAYPVDAQIWVLLDEGSVSLEAGRKAYNLSPGQCALYNRNTGICSISIPRNKGDYTIWRMNGLYFHLTKLGDILKVVERQRGVHFIIKDSQMLNSKFTLSSRNEDVENILEDIETVSDVNFVKYGKKQYIVTSK